MIVNNGDQEITCWDQANDLFYGLTLGFYKHLQINVLNSTEVTGRQIFKFINLKKYALFIEQIGAKKTWGIPVSVQ